MVGGFAADERLDGVAERMVETRAEVDDGEDEQRAERYSAPVAATHSRLSHAYVEARVGCVRAERLAVAALKAGNLDRPPAAERLRGSHRALEPHLHCVFRRGEQRQIPTNTLRSRLDGRVHLEKSVTSLARLGRHFRRERLAPRLQQGRAKRAKTSLRAGHGLEFLWLASWLGLAVSCWHFLSPRSSGNRHNQAELSARVTSCRLAHRPCHAEGRGFESHHPLPRKPRSRGFFVAEFRLLASRRSRSQPLVSLRAVAGAILRPSQRRDYRTGQGRGCAFRRAWDGPGRLPSHVTPR
jgi:hypothetical protein